MKIIFSFLTFFIGGFLAYGVGVLIYKLRRGPSLFVGLTPIILAFVVMALTKSGGYIDNMSIFEAGETGLSLGMASIVAFLFWSQRSWGP
jgi:hypothetical protein